MRINASLKRKQSFLSQVRQALRICSSVLGRDTGITAYRALVCQSAALPWESNIDADM